MNTSLRQLLAGAVVGVASATVHAGLPFTVDEASIASLNCGAGPGQNTCFQVTATKINGEYTEVITFDGAGNFVTSAFAELTQLVGNNNPSRLAAVPGFTGDQYGLYALFTSAGTVAGGIFTGTSASMTVYIDADANTTNAAPATGAGVFTLGNTGDDYEVANAENITFGYGEVVAGIGGFFDIRFDDFTLTAAGANYFVDPDPFHLRTILDGDLDDFTIAGTQTITGDVSVEFVPEPGSLALVGLALSGLALSLRRKQS